MKALVKYEAARRALAEAKSVDEVKKIRDKAEAMRAYARQAGDPEFAFWAGEIKLRAERRAGGLLKEMAASGEREDRGGDRKSKSPRAALKLPDLGVTNSQSSRWQQTDDLSELEYEQWIGKIKSRGTPFPTLSARALSEQIDLSRGGAFRSLRRCAIPSVISTARPR